MQYWFDLLIKSQGRRLYWGILWVVITAVSGVSLLMLSGWFITATALAGIAISAGIMLLFDMYMPGSGIRFFALSRTIGRYTERVYNHDTVLRLIATFRVTIFEKLTRIPAHELRASSDSEWLGKLTADLDALDSILLRYTIPTAAAAIVILLISGFLSFIWLELALYLGGFFTLIYIFNISLTISSTKKLASDTSLILSELRADIIGHVKGVFELQSYQLMQAHETSILKRLETLNTIQRDFHSRVANVQLLLDISLATALIVLACVALYAADSGAIDGPVAVLLVMMYVGVSEILQSVPSQISSWGKTQFAANRLKAMLVREQGSEKPVISDIHRVSASIEREAKIPLSMNGPLEFSVEKSKVLLILGRSGSGKSSLANLLAGLETSTDKGSKILINNAYSPDNIEDESLYSHLAYLEQSNSLLAGTLGYNLAVGLPSVTESQLWSVLKVVELEQWVQNLAAGLNTWLGEGGSRVSGGQARRICMARLLLRQVSLVILDEPFNGIDAQMASRIWLNMSQWLEDKMLVILMHEQPIFLNNITPEQIVNLDLN
jgi:ATP-binding cassette subfamily C protein CydC